MVDYVGKLVVAKLIKFSMYANMCNAYKANIVRMIRMRVAETMEFY